MDRHITIVTKAAACTSEFTEFTLEQLVDMQTRLRYAMQRTLGYRAAHPELSHRAFATLGRLCVEIKRRDVTLFATSDVAFF